MHQQALPPLCRGLAACARHQPWCEPWIRAGKERCKKGLRGVAWELQLGSVSHPWRLRELRYRYACAWGQSWSRPADLSSWLHLGLHHDRPAEQFGLLDDLINISRPALLRSFGYCGTLVREDSVVACPAVTLGSWLTFPSGSSALLLLCPSALTMTIKHMYRGLRSGVTDYSWDTRLSSYPTGNWKSENCKDVWQKLKNISISHKGSEKLWMPKSFTMLFQKMYFPL